MPRSEGAWSHSGIAAAKGAPDEITASGAVRATSSAFPIDEGYSDKVEVDLFNAIASKTCT